MDTSDWSKGIASLLNEGQKAASQLQNLFRQSGLRAGARFLGVGAPLFAAYESYRIAEQYVKELEAEQTKAIENIYKQVDAFRGTDLYPTKLKEAHDQIENLRNSTKGWADDTVGAVTSIKNSFAGISEKGPALMARIGSSILATNPAVTLAQAFGGKSSADTYKSFMGAVDSEGQEALADNANKAKFEALRARDEKEKSEAREQVRLDNEESDAKIAGKPTDKQIEYYKSQLDVVNRARTSNPQGIADAAKKEGLSGVEVLQQMESRAIELEKKIGELTKKQDEEETAALNKKREQAALDERIVDLLATQTELTEKKKGLGDALLDVEKEQFMSQNDLDDIQDTHSEEYAKALEHLNEVTRQRQELEQKITENQNRQIELKNQQVELEARHNQMQQARLERTDAEIKAGKGGTAQQTLERAYERKEAEAQRMFDKAAEDRAKSFDPRTGTWDKSNPAYKRAQDEYARAKKLQAQADTLHGATGSKEGFEQLLSDKTFKDEMQKNRTEVENITKILGPLLKPTAIK